MSKLQIAIAVIIACACFFAGMLTESLTTKAPVMECPPCPDLQCPPAISLGSGPQFGDTKKFKKNTFTTDLDFYGPVYLICDGDTSMIREALKPQEK